MGESNTVVSAYTTIDMNFNINRKCWYSCLALSQPSPGFYVSALQFLKTLWEKEKLLVRAISPFTTLFSIRLKNFLPFSSNLKLSSAKSFSLKESKIGMWSKGLTLRHATKFRTRSRVVKDYINSLRSNWF